MITTIDSPKLTTADAARYLAVSVRYLKQLRQNGRGPTFTKLGSHVVYSIEDLERWAVAHRRTQTGGD